MKKKWMVSVVACMIAGCKEDPPPPPPPPPPSLSGTLLAEAQASLNEARAFAVASDDARNQALNAKQLPKLATTLCAIPSTEFIREDQRPTDSSLIATLLPRINFQPPSRAPSAPPDANTATGLDRWIEDKHLAHDAAFYAPVTAEQRVANIKDALATFKKRPELLLVATEFEAPVAQGSTFSPGRLVGTLYVWSPEQRRLTCGAEVDAESSAEVSARYVRGGALESKPNKGGAVLRDLLINSVYGPLHHLVETAP